MRGLRRGRRCIICTTQISAQRSANKLCKLLNAGIYQIKACANLHVERQLKPYKQTGRLPLVLFDCLETQ